MRFSSMCISTRKIPYLLIPVVTWFRPSFTFGQEADASAGLDLDKIVERGTDTLGRALNGNSDAQMALLREYAAPALAVCAALVISYTVASAIGRMTGKLVSDKVDLTLGKFFAKAIRNVIMLIVVMMVLQYFGVHVTGFAAVLAAAGFAVGMALQGTLGNFASGVMLLVFRPFKVDDYIKVAGTEGTVEEIDLFTTRLNSLDNRHLIIPNGEIFGSLLENYTRNQTRRVDVSIGAAYDADLQETRTALEQAIQKVQLAGLADAQESQVVLTGLGASSVDWQVRAWCKPEDYWAVKEQLTVAAKESLDAAKISIPFPQMDVNVVGKVLTRSQAA